jgi:hypothetical protein
MALADRRLGIDTYNGMLSGARAPLRPGNVQKNALASRQAACVEMDTHNWWARPGSQTLSTIALEQRTKMRKPYHIHSLPVNDPPEHPSQ